MLELFRIERLMLYNLNKILNLGTVLRAASTCLRAVKKRDRAERNRVGKLMTGCGPQYNGYGPQQTKTESWKIQGRKMGTHCGP